MKEDMKSSVSDIRTDDSRWRSPRGPALPGLLPLPLPRLRSWLWLLFVSVAGISLPVQATTAASPQQTEQKNSGWDGLWFECEFSQRNAPPPDDCAMLDDDGFLFSGERVTYVKLVGGTETACKKNRVGQCFAAATPNITIKHQRQGRAILSANSIGLAFLGCVQRYHTTSLGAFIEARPDRDRCFWARDRFFYLRKYQGEIRDRQ